jgi:hypothetical protein
VDEQKQATLAQVVTDYLTNTKPLMLVVHLVYIAAITAVFSTAYVVAFHFTSLVSVYEEAHSITSFSSNLKTSVENDNAIYADLNRLLNDSGGSRAYAYRYHNGLAAISGVPFFFQTMTHEVISPGTARILPFEQRIPASIHMAINNAFVNDKCAVIKNTDRDKENQDYYFWTSRGAKHLIRCPIYMSNGDLFGFVGVDWTADIKDTENSQKQIKQAADHIAQLFANNKH